MRATHEPLTVLVIEDDPLLGLDLSDALSHAGFRPAGPVATLTEAAREVSRRTPDVAILDVRLADGLSSGLARELRRRRVPFVVHSACRRDGALCPELRDAPWLAKPAWPPDVVAAVAELGSGRALR